MGKISLGATVSIDGFIADPADQVGPLFDWYSAGPTATNYGDEKRVFHTDDASAAHMGREAVNIGACVIGRRLFDLTDGWAGRPPAGDAVFVVTHRAVEGWPFPDAPFTFVTDGVEAAIEQARQFAGTRDVSVAAGDVGGQALHAGLIDEIHLDVAPVVLGQGRRFFGSEGAPPLMLDDPRVVVGCRVTHLLYTVRRDIPIVVRSNAELRAMVDTGTQPART